MYVEVCKSYAPSLEHTKPIKPYSLSSLERGLCNAHPYP